MVGAAPRKHPRETAIANRRKAALEDTNVPNPQFSKRAAYGLAVNLPSICFKNQTLKAGITNLRMRDVNVT